MYSSSCLKHDYGVVDYMRLRKVSALNAGGHNLLVILLRYYVII